MNEKKTPRIRFKGFTDDWKQRKLGDLLQTLPFKQFLKEPEPDGKYEIIQQGNEPVIGFANGTPCGDYKDVVIFGDHTLSLYKPQHPFFVATDGVRIVKGQQDTDGYYLLSLLERYKPQSEGYKRYYSILADTNCITTYNTSEQEKIGAFFKLLDSLITLHQRKYEKLQIIKKLMLENCFPKNGEKVPKIRFSGFTGDWEQRKLGDLMDVGSVKRVHQADWRDSGVRFLRARDVVADFNNEEPDDYLYIDQKMYEEYSAQSGKVQQGDLLVTGVGTIGIPMLIKSEKPLYFKDGNIIWFKNKNAIDGQFFYYSFISKGIQDFIKESAGIGTVGTYTIDSGKKTPINLPTSIEEQKKIGIYFKNLDHLITLHQSELEKLQKIKKSLLERMFV